MASANWQKQTKEKAGFLICHNGQEEREEKNHSNEDINKDLTPMNYFIGCDDYKDAYREMVKRVDEVDEMFPPKKIAKDRKVCCSINIPCILEITDEGKSREFFEESYKIATKFFGEKNVHGMSVHLDEVHDYIDAETGELRTSLEHGTILVSCYAEWKEPVWELDENGVIKKEPALDKNGQPKLDTKGNPKMKNIQAKDENGQLLWEERAGINGKHFETREALDNFNKELCDMVKERFGLNYNTGEGKRKGKTVETMKVKSEEVEAKQMADKAFEDYKQEAELKIASAEKPSIFGKKDEEKFITIPVKEYKQLVGRVERISVIEEKEKKQKFITEQQQKKEKRLINERNTLEKEKKEIPVAIEKGVQERLEKSEIYNTLMQTADAYKRRYEALFRKPFDKPFNKQIERNDVNGNKTPATNEKLHNRTATNKGYGDR